MKIRKIIISMVAVLAVTVPVTVFAATSTSTAAVSIRHFFGAQIDSSKLTDAQKADVKTYTKKMAEVEKEFINKMVSNGTLSTEQGAAATKRIDAALENGTYALNLFEKDDHGRGMGQGGAGMPFIDESKLTEQQKAEFKAIYMKMADNQKNLLTQLVAAKLITQTQANNAISEIDQEKGKDSLGFKPAKGIMGIRGLGIDPSKLTTEQKALFSAYKEKNLELCKEMVNKAVASGMISQTQADSMLERMQNNKGQKGFHFEDGKRDKNDGTRDKANTKPL